MGFNNYILRQEDALQLDQCLARFVEDTSVSLAVLMGRDGHLLCQKGDSKGIQLESLCALTVGTFVSSEALASLAGEDTFNSIFHQGSKSNVFISQVGEEHLLLSVFDYHSSIPQVRLQSKIIAESLAIILAKSSSGTRTTK